MEIKKIDVMTSDKNKKLSIASGSVIIKDGKVLLVRGRDGTHFKFPGGYIKDDENLKETAKREVIEEISCEVELFGDPIFYYLNNISDSLDIFLVHYRTTIINGKPEPSSEIVEVKWFDINSLPKNTMENIAPVILKLQDYAKN